MTLCIGWRERGVLNFAADSRISFPENHPFDGAVKLISVRMEIDMINPITCSDEELFYGNTALCFAGSTVNAFALREELSDRLTSMLAPSYSFDEIAKSAFSVYVDISRKLCYSLAGDKGQSAVIFAGYCFESQRERAFLFEPSPLQQNEYEFSNVLEHDGDYLFLGSGREIAEQIFSSIEGQPVTQNSFLAILTEVIRDEASPTVGGRIRVGQFDRHSFRSSWHHCQISHQPAGAGDVPRTPSPQTPLG